MCVLFVRYNFRANVGQSLRGHVKLVNNPLLSYRLGPISDGWLSSPNVRRCPSPNYNERPDSEEVSLLVIHNISLPPGEFQNGCIERFFTNCLCAGDHPYFATIADLQVSAHCLIQRDGAVIQFVPFHLRAWHAGQSEFRGRKNCNDYSVGVELEGADDVPYTDEQYEVLSCLTRELMISYPAIEVGRIVGHADIAPQRKTDPGPAFDWSRYHGRLESLCT